MKQVAGKMEREFFCPKIYGIEVVFVECFADLLQIFVRRFDRSAVMKSVMQVDGFGIHEGFEEIFGVRQGLQGKISVGIGQFVEAVLVGVRGEQTARRKDGRTADDGEILQKCFSVHRNFF